MWPDGWSSLMVGQSSAPARSGRNRQSSTFRGPMRRFQTDRLVNLMTAGSKCNSQDNVTVIVCTYNRCHDLATALESIAASQMPESTCWDILVVDNNSTDATRDVIEGFCQRYPGRFRYLFEPNAGKSHALNAGIANARGEVLAFTDDDVTVEPTWLCNLTRSLCDGDYIGAGGRILPAQPFKPPRWLPTKLSDWGGIVCAYFNLGDEARNLDRAPYGANMSFRKGVFARYGGFRLDLGPNPSDIIGNEDTEFGRRLMAAGERLRYEPTAIVYHPVPSARITREYFLSWWFGYGRAAIRELGDRPKVCGIPRDYLSLLRFAAKMPILTMRWIFSINSQKRFCNACWIWHAAGRMAELYRRSVPNRRPRSSRTPDNKPRPRQLGSF